MKEEILITGGAGFLGSHLCDKFAKAKCEVDRLYNSYTGSKKNVAYLVSNPLFSLIRHDVTFPIYLEMGQIHNFACPASPIYYQFDPVQTAKSSVHGAINMLGSPSARAHASCRRPRARSTATRKCIPSPSHTWAGSIPSASAAATTKESASPRHCSSPTDTSEGWI